jgi:hypothetical protein
MVFFASHMDACVFAARFIFIAGLGCFAWRVQAVCVNAANPEMVRKVISARDACFMASLSGAENAKDVT